MKLMPGIVDLTQPNYKNSEVYGKIDVNSYIGCALTINSLILGKADTTNYVTGAIKVSDNVEEEIDNG